MFDYEDLSIRILELVSRSIDVMDPQKITAKDITALTDLALKLHPHESDSKLHVRIYSNDKVMMQTDDWSDDVEIGDEIHVNEDGSF